MNKEERKYFRDVEHKSVLAPSIGMTLGLAGLVGGHKVVNMNANKRVVDSILNHTAGRGLQIAGGTVGLLASGSLAHRINRNNRANHNAEMYKGASEYYDERGYVGPGVAIAAGAYGVHRAKKGYDNGIAELARREAEKASAKKAGLIEKIKKKISAVKKTPGTIDLAVKAKDSAIKAKASYLNKKKFNAAGHALDTVQSLYGVANNINARPNLTKSSVGRRAALAAVVPSVLIAGGLSTAANRVLKNDHNKAKNEYIRSKQ
jgi:hypothetical protein